MTKPAPSIARRFASWVVLLLLVAIVVWAFAVYVSSIIDMPPWLAAIAGLRIRRSTLPQSLASLPSLAPVSLN